MKSGMLVVSIKEEEFVSITLKGKVIGEIYRLKDRRLGFKFPKEFRIERKKDEGNK